jgi:hypothetical protein
MMVQYNVMNGESNLYQSYSKQKNEMPFESNVIQN